MLSFRFIARATLALAAPCGVLLFACGGAELSPLDQTPGFANASQPDASLPATLQDSSASPSPGNGNKDTGTPHDSAGPPNPPPSDDSGNDSSQSEDSGEDSAPPADPGIPCASKFCDPTTKVCCVSTNGSGNPTYECETTSSCNNKGGLSMPCASAADCTAAGSPPGTVCCVTEVAGVSNAGSVACVPAAQCSAPTQAWMCNQAAPECPPGDSCTTSQTTIPPYSICTP